MIAGIAVIMMFFFHFFAYPDLQPNNDCYYAPIKHLGVPLEQIIAPFGQLCVAIFAFNSGFIIAKRESEYKIEKRNFKRILKFLIGYWIICLLFLAIGISSQSKIPPLDIFISNLFGLKLSARADYINVAHGWYVTYYILLVALAPALIYLFKRTNLVYDLAIITLLILIIPNTHLQIKSIIWPINASLIGFIAYKYAIFDTLKKYISRFYNNTIPVVLSIIVLLIVFCLRHFASGYNAWWRFDGIYALLFISAVLSIINHIGSTARKTLCYIGSISMYLWFIHSIFAVGNDEIRQILYYPYLPILILVWGIALCIIPSLLIRKIHSLLIRSI